MSSESFLTGNDDINIITSKNQTRVNQHLPLLNHKKLKKKGIIYLSTIPPFMNVTKITEIMGQFGQVGRVFLQPAVYKTKNGTLKKNKRNKKALQFTEGWIEFLSKRVAKHVAVTLNNTRIGEHKKSKYYDHLWNLKYLPRFKWVHLNERLEYERAVFKQRMRAEIAQAKREASHFANTIDQHELFKKTFKKSLPSTDDIQFLFKQRQTDEEIKRTKKSKNIERESRTQFLKSLFGNE
uniref:Activator of basal transcription 1 n=1 Tax=Clastoptera arizonana TaxID=38151 RepID=A0A1B6CRS9_9HEMI